MGPLHGLPVSFKDSFNIEGVQSTVGYVSFLKHPPAKSNSALVSMLLDLGAVLYVKTNIPQTMMVCHQTRLPQAMYRVNAFICRRATRITTYLAVP
jgi:Asp-tRNA(Asn)/Glu-tRNA(Gln) amidotransferase A subunit family amidase